MRRRGMEDHSGAHQYTEHSSAWGCAEDSDAAGDLGSAGETDLEEVMSLIFDFLAVYRMYRKQHSAMYAARIAYGIVFKALPF